MSSIRVWLETRSSVTRAGLETLLQDFAELVFVESAARADVILREDMPSGPDYSTPIIVLTDEPFTSRAFGSGVRAVLARNAPPEQIAAAMHAVAAGLMVAPTEFSSALLVEDTSNEANETMDVLTPRELVALEMLAEGLSNKQIAARMGISDHTAKFHVNSILAKLHAGTRTEAVMRGIRLGLVKV